MASGLLRMDFSGVTKQFHLIGMTKRQRVIAEEECPLPPTYMPESERITYARKRIQELELLIKHWKEHDRRLEQVRQEESLS